MDRLVQVANLVSEMTAVELVEFVTAFNMPDGIIALSKGVSHLRSGKDVSLYVMRVTPEGQYPKKIQCIKAIRELTGWGLKETKDAVDWLDDTNQGTVILSGPYPEMVEKLSNIPSLDGYKFYVE